MLFCRSYIDSLIRTINCNSGKNLSFAFLPQLYGRRIRIINYNSGRNLSFAFLPQLYDSLVRIINCNSGKNLSFAFLPQLYGRLIRIIIYNSGKNFTFCFCLCSKQVPAQFFFAYFRSDIIQLKLHLYSNSS
jgi:hypothetical protein